MKLHTFQEIEGILHSERINAYRQDSSSDEEVVSRYLFNVALCEAFYPSLQFAEVALRNAVNFHLCSLCKTESWYDSPIARLTAWQKLMASEAKKSLLKFCKPITPSRMVAELTLGFWTSFFNKAHARSGLGSYLSKTAFPCAPSFEQYQAKLDKRWQEIRNLRNRVFHHERILHWNDLEARHESVMRIIAWMSPELHKLVESLDRFMVVMSNGSDFWNERLKSHFSS